MRPLKSWGAISDQTVSQNTKWKKIEPLPNEKIMGVYFLPFCILTHRLVTNGTSNFRGLYFKMPLTPIGLIFDKKYRHHQTHGKILS